MENNVQKKKKIFVGEVVSASMDKTVVATTKRTYKHKHFHKIMTVSKKFKIHDEHEVASVGDTIEFYEGRPVSKTKYMYLMRVVNKS